jgi:agmatine deiminase
LQEQDVFGKTPLDEINFIFEGGGIESDGAGTIMLTRHWLSARHPDLSEQQLEQKLKLYFGAEHILWLDHGYLAGDDTDSHIDTLARFVDPKTIAYVRCDDPEDEHFAEFENMEHDLKNFKTADGKEYQLIPLPWPKKIFSEEQQKRLPATYANFLITNGAVLAPVYGDSADKAAIQQLHIAFPQHKIVPINCRYIVEYYGSLHCATMQLPEGVL